MERSQFTFYRSFAEAAGRIRSKSARCDYYESIINYALFEREPAYDAIADAAAMGFVLIRPTLDASRQKAISGQRGGKSEANRKREDSGSTPEAEADLEEHGTEKEEENENEKEKEDEKKKEKESCKGSAFTAAERERMIRESLKEFSEALREAVRSWAQYKSERREPYKQMGFEALLSRIAGSARDYGEKAVIDIISQSMSSGYKGILFDRIGQNRPQPRKSMADLHKNQPSQTPEEIRKSLERLKNLDHI